MGVRQFKVPDVQMFKPFKSFKPLNSIKRS